MAEYTVTVSLTDTDLIMIRALAQWADAHPGRSPMRKQIEDGYGEHRFDKTRGRDSGPRTFKRLVMLGVIEYCRNGRCWLTFEGWSVIHQMKTG